MLISKSLHRGCVDVRCAALCSVAGRCGCAWGHRVLGEYSRPTARYDPAFVSPVASCAVAIATPPLTVRLQYGSVASDGCGAVCACSGVCRRRAHGGAVGVDRSAAPFVRAPSAMRPSVSYARASRRAVSRACRCVAPAHACVSVSALTLHVGDDCSGGGGSDGICSRRARRTRCRVLLVQNELRHC